MKTGPNAGVTRKIMSHEDRTIHFAAMSNENADDSTDSTDATTTYTVLKPFLYAADLDAYAVTLRNTVYLHYFDQAP